MSVDRDSVPQVTAVDPVGRSIGRSVSDLLSTADAHDGDLCDCSRCERGVVRSLVTLHLPLACLQLAICHFRLCNFRFRCLGAYIPAAVKISTRTCNYDLRVSVCAVERNKRKASAEWCGYGWSLVCVDSDRATHVRCGRLDVDPGLWLGPGLRTIDQSERSGDRLCNRTDRHAKCAQSVHDGTHMTESEHSAVLTNAVVRSR